MEAAHCSVRIVQRQGLRRPRRRHRRMRRWHDAARKTAKCAETAQASTRNGFGTGGAGLKMQALSLNLSTFFKRFTASWSRL